MGYCMSWELVQCVRKVENIVVLTCGGDAVIFQDQGLFGYGLCIENSNGASDLAKTDCRMGSPHANEVEAHALAEALYS